MKNILIVSIILILFSNCQSNYNKKMIEPSAKKIPIILNYHSDTLTDNYFWMRLSDEQKESENPDSQTKDVLDYLKAENHFLDVNMSDTDELQSKLFDEYVSRIKQDDTSVPYQENGYIYSSKYIKGENYRRYFRKKNKEDSKEELFLDLPKLANKKKYFSLGDWSISTNNKILAYSIDIVSRESIQYILKI